MHQLIFTSQHLELCDSFTHITQGVESINQLNTLIGLVPLYHDVGKLTLQGIESGLTQSSRCVPMEYVSLQYDYHLEGVTLNGG